MDFLKKFGEEIKLKILTSGDYKNIKILEINKNNYQYYFIRQCS